VVDIFHYLFSREVHADSDKDSESYDELPEDKRKILFNKRKQAALNLKKCMNHQIAYEQISVYENLK